MKNLILAVAILFIAASCQKQVVDCDQVRSKCKYVQYSYTDCTPNGSELGWNYDRVYSDTTYFSTVGCPDLIEADFIRQQQKTIDDRNTPENVRHFMLEFPSTCDCN